MKKIFGFTLLLAAMIALAGCHTNVIDERDDYEEELPEYIALDSYLGVPIDYAILGKDASGYFYEFQEENPLIPKRLSIYDGYEDIVKLTVNFNEEGLPEAILSENFTITLGNYEDNKFDAVVIIKEECAIFEDIDIDYRWDDYKNDLSAPQTRALPRPSIKQVNAIIGAVGCGVSIAATVMAAPTGFGAVIGWGLTSISCTGAIMSIADAAEWIDIPNESAIANTAIGHYANLASCALINNPASVIACLAGLANNVTSIADLIADSKKEDINLGKGSLISGNGEIKITLTWDNYADIDLHCIDPSGFHIYFDDPQSPTGGYLDYDNTEAYGPENIYFNPAPQGEYQVYIHYYEENKGINSVNYKVVIYNNSLGQIYSGTIEGEDTVIQIATILSNVSSATRNATDFSKKIDWNNLPRKSKKAHINASLPSFWKSIK